MARRGFLEGFLLATLLLLAFFTARLHRNPPNPFPPLAVSLSSRVANLKDFGALSLGLRRLGADIAWIQTLQYYGTQEEGQSEFEFENGIGKYPDFLALSQRVALIDPYFTYIYYFGSAALAWNMNRAQEAEELLRLGIQNNPHEWRLQQYLGALAFQKNHDPKKLADFLEGYIGDPECPNILRSILANLYKKQARYRDSMRVWFVILDSKDPAYKDRAENQIQELAPLAGLPTHLTATPPSVVR